MLILSRKIRKSFMEEDITTSQDCFENYELINVRCENGA